MGEKGNKTMDIYEIIDELNCVDTEDVPLADKAECAKALLGACIELTQQVIEETHDENARAYLLDHLRIMHGDGHGFLSRDMNFDRLIERANKSEERED